LSAESVPQRVELEISTNAQIDDDEAEVQEECLKLLEKINENIENSYTSDEEEEQLPENDKTDLEEKQQQDAIRQLQAMQEIVSSSRKAKALKWAKTVLSASLSITSIAIGIATMNPMTIVSGVFDLSMFAMGRFPNKITLDQLSDKLKKIDKRLDFMDKKLDQLNETAKSLNLTQKANTIINQITPAMAEVGTLWMQTQNYKRDFRDALESLCEQQKGSECAGDDFVSRWMPRQKLIQKNL